MILPLATASAQAPVVITEGRMLHISGLSENDKEAIRKILTIPNPRRLQAKKYSGFVDRSLPETLTGYEDMPGDEMMVAPGAGFSVWHSLKAAGRTVEYRKPSLPEWADPIEYRGQSRDYQDPAVETMAVRQNAVVVGPCGCGKTDMALRVMGKRACPFLIVAHMRKLTKQWKERIEQRMWGRIGTAVSMYSPGKKIRWDPNSPFVIATVQALRLNPADVVALAGEGRAIWVDECHHTPCTTFTDVLALGAWRYRYGVTATPIRSDGTTALLHWWVGPIVATVERSQVEDSGHLLRPRLEVITTNYADTYNPDEPGDSQRLMGRLCDDPNRLSRVASTVAKLFLEGRHILVCVDRIQYGDDLQVLLADINVSSEFCHAKLPKATQDNIMWNIANGHERVLIATSLADEGLDLPILDTVVLATPSGSATRTEQRMGRAARPLAGKLEPLVVDIVDPLVARVDESGTTHRIFLNQFRSRYQKVYRKMTHCDHDAVKRLLKGRQDHVLPFRSTAAQ